MLYIYVTSYQQTIEVQTCLYTGLSLGTFKQ